ncbi:MAG: nitrophenyl compound nitroreductase subunit ArsF family protein [Bacteroides sp.]|uniref:nitrophenyl compound nitroreductase subunit ArsF family protein n=2 Tax=Bacteroides sp. TaxID=29523 RepID=UPI002FC63D26
MKKFLFVLLAIIGLTSCGNNQKSNAHTAIPTAQKEYVEVLYFHGKQRCVTCNAIEKLTGEVMEKDFAKQVENGKVVFKVIDISTGEGEKIADKYEVTWSSLYINQWKDGKETQNNMTDFGFSYAKDSPDTFKSEIKKKIEELLK